MKDPITEATQPLLVERDDEGIVRLTLNRAPQRNSLSQALVDSLLAALRQLREDREARVIILTGAGDKAFCAGADLKERAQMGEAQVAAFVDTLREMAAMLAQLPQPTIAAINGAALGGGLELALACDLRVMAEGAFVGLPEVKLGIIPGAGGTQRLTRLIGPGRAKALIFTGRRVQAQEALALGLVEEVAPEGGLREATLSLATSMLSGAPIALAQAKRAMDQGLDVSLEAGLAIEREAYAVTIPTEDRREALAAFQEKRAPVFQGR